MVDILPGTMVTVKQLKKALTEVTDAGNVNDEDLIVWADSVDKDGDPRKFEKDPVGTIWLGILKADGNTGTIRVQPDRISKHLM